MSKHFARHLENKHRCEDQVVTLLGLKKGSEERKALLTLIRNNGNMESHVLIPKKLEKAGYEVSTETHVMCSACHSYLKRRYLFRHRKNCFAAKGNELPPGRSAITDSMIYAACKKKYGKYISEMNLKTRVLGKMRPNKETEVVLGDILIMSWGDDLLKKTPCNKSTYHIAAKMKRCARFVMNMKKINTKYNDMLACMKPEAFDDVIEATKNMSGFDPIKKTYTAGSTALQFGGYLKQISSLTEKIILRGKISLSTKQKDDCLKEIKRFRSLISSQWTTEVASLAMKDLTKRAAKKPKLLPTTEDIMMCSKYVAECAKSAYEQLQKKALKKAFSILAETTLVSTIIHNRKRVGDVMYLELEYYNDQRTLFAASSQTHEFQETLSENEKLLTKNYLKITTIGKNSKDMAVLIPPLTLKYYDLIYKLRTTHKDWFFPENEFMFCYPASAKQIEASSVLRKYAMKCGAKCPESITSTRLRKHVAVVSQLLSLRDNEVEQLAKFMGHTKKTHEQYYK